MAVLKLTCLVVRIWVNIKTMALQKVPDRATYCPEYPDKQEKREKPLSWQSGILNLEEEFQFKFEKTDLPVVFRWSGLNYASEGFSHPDAAKVYFSFKLCEEIKSLYLLDHKH